MTANYCSDCSDVFSVTNFAMCRYTLNLIYWDKTTNLSELYILFSLVGLESGVV